MRKSFIGLLVASLVLTLLLGFDYVVHAAPNTDFRNQGVGTYYGLFDLGGGVFLPFMANTTIDGTVTTADGTDGGLTGTSNSGGVGRWRRTGPRETTTETLYLGFDSETGVPTTATRATGVIQFDTVRLENGSGVNTTRTYDLSLGEDPMNPEGGNVTGAFPFTVSKIY
jgi:hypothetical protein